MLQLTRKLLCSSIKFIISLKLSNSVESRNKLNTASVTGPNVWHFDLGLTNTAFKPALVRWTT